MSLTSLLLIYCVLILVASLAGGLIPLMVRLTHRRIQAGVSFVAGMMLGVGLLHLLPHALLAAPGAIHAVFLWVLAGFLVMFFTERFFCFHHHEVPQVGKDSLYGHQAEACPHVRSDAHALTWSGAAVGLTLHTVFNGIALAASVEAESHAGAAGALAGLGTFLVIFLHKPFDAMTISTLMTLGGWSTMARHIVNGLFALKIPLGVLLFYVGMGRAHGEGNLLAYALAFSAGNFLCIASSDLLPELHFHAHDRGALSAALLTGLAIAVLIGVVEQGSHGHPHGPAGAAAVDSHDHGPEAARHLGHDHQH